MQGVSVLFFLGILGCCASAQFLNHRPFPTYSLENMPDTGFTCRGKILGGYYADPDTQCQMFHICVKVAGVGVQDFRFLCPNGTAFDQDHQICAEWEDVDCDSTTLYYSSDNFDLYRIGSGFESKAVKYGEDEETFSLQRAETGDQRLNREHQSKNVDQNKDAKNFNQKPRQNNNHNNNNNRNNDNRNNDNSEKDIFKGSSSSNFFNNRNNGKEKDEDYDDNVNVNQDNNYETRRKVVRNKIRRPVQNNNNQNDEYNRSDNNNNRNRNSNNFEARKTETQEPQSRRTQKPVTFTNNYAGSSYLPTTSKPSTTTLTSEQYTTALNHYRTRNGQRQRQFTPEYEASSTPVYTISTPAPFKQNQQYNAPPNRPANTPVTENYPQQKPVSKSTANYDDQYDIPKIKSTTIGQNYNTQYDNQKIKQTASTAAQNYNTQYDVPKTKQTPSTFSTADQTYETTKIKQNSFPTKTTPYEKTENYPSNNPAYSNGFDKKSTTPLKQSDNYPTTFAPRTNSGYTQISQQTVSYSKNTQSTGFSQYSSTQTKNSTPKNTPFNTQYTPTVPKVASTTPVSRSNRFDETEYDDGSYSSKYEYDGDKKEDEFLKTAHSQNIAASRNELAKTTKSQSPQTQYTQSTQKQTQITQSTQKQTPSTQKPTSYQTPRAFSVTQPEQKPTSAVTKSNPRENTKSTQAPVQNKSFNLSPKKTKDVSYDYAYYDTGVGSEPDYELDTEIKKSTAKN